MSTTVPAVEARRNLGRFLNIVELRHEEVTIERAGKPIAKLAPVDSSPSTPGKGKLDLRDALGLGRDVWEGVDADAYVAGEREQWD